MEAYKINGTFAYEFELCFMDQLYSEIKPVSFPDHTEINWADEILKKN
ncbi:hypothetical protein OAU04_02320 [Alphaproteobacteria bacterium]|nr:hypothetical protein [Alphaproteobacteria bacterium]